MADSDCVLLCLTRERYDALVTQYHSVALAIQRVILTRAAIHRNKLERELYAVSAIQREALRESRQTQMRSYRLQLRYPCAMPTFGDSFDVCGCGVC